MRAMVTWFLLVRTAVGSNRTGRGPGRLIDLVVERTVKAIEDGKRSRRKVLQPTVQLRGSLAAARATVQRTAARRTAR